MPRRPSAPRRARVPRRTLYRVSYPPDPLAWPPWFAVGRGRFDDPLGRYRVIYVAERRLTAILEVLQDYRLSVDAIAALQALPGPGPDLTGKVPSDWHEKRVVGGMRLWPDQRFLDLTSLQTCEALRVEPAHGPPSPRSRSPQRRV
jgi:hypothetical protein